MQYSTAETLMDLFLRHLGEQNPILNDVQAKETPEDFQRVKAMIGATMGVGAICLDALNPILAEHPSLRAPGLAQL